MEQDGRLIGQNMFMKTVTNADDGRDIPVLTMGLIKENMRGSCLTDLWRKRGADIDERQICAPVHPENFDGILSACGDPYSVERLRDKRRI